jgi:hypothetical protein
MYKKSSIKLVVGRTPLPPFQTYLLDHRFYLSLLNFPFSISTILLVAINVTSHLTFSLLNKLLFPFTSNEPEVLKYFRSPLCNFKSSFNTSKRAREYFYKLPHLFKFGNYPQFRVSFCGTHCEGLKDKRSIFLFPFLFSKLFLLTDLSDLSSIN